MQLRNIHRGDTIVEVLIALAVLGLALGIGFATVGRSNSSLQANKEQFQAQQLANQQVEYLRISDAGANGGVLRNTFSASPVCMEENGGKISVVEGNEKCKDKAMGGAPIYTIDISCVGNSGIGKGENYCFADNKKVSVYRVVITWSDVKGGTSTLELQYAM